jgi:zinc protease
MNKFILNQWKKFAAFSFILFTCFVLSAQNESDKPLPFDPDVRMGKLKNGLTYYIRKNNKPEKRVEFRLAVNAGSILEDPDQLGLAHFVEHMAFNGTKNFEKNELVHYLQSIGMKFGPELNAFTSFDETVYMLTIPADSAEVLKKGFQIMEDWAHNLLFDTAEINKERGVLVEEWRLGRGPFQRMEDKYIPVLFNGSRYAERLPIGKREVLEGADYGTIKKFYTDWYRPDLMAFIVVGDIDVAATEKTIQEMFGRIPATKKPRPRPRFEVPDHQQTLIAITSDKEAPYSIVQVICKINPNQKTTYAYYKQYLISQLITGMVNQRLNELKEKADPALLYSVSYFGSSWIREKNAYICAGIVPETGIERGIQTLLEENERIIRHGFMQGELDRQKKSTFTYYENAFNERDKTDSKNYAQEYVSHFLTKEPSPGIAFEFEFIKKYLDSITLEEINEFARKIIRKDNRVIIIQTPEKEEVKIPSESDVYGLIAKVEASAVDPYVDKMSGLSLMTEIPVAGKIMLTRKKEDMGITEMTLANGAKVILKPTDFKNDEILFRAFSPGGYSVYPETDFMSASNAADIIRECGVASFTPTEISKLLAGKKLSLSPYISAYFEGFSGSAVPKDLEPMLQLLHLYFTAPRKDLELFQSYISKQKGIIANLLSEPENYFSDKFMRIKTQNNPRVEAIPTIEDIDKINPERVYDIYKERFSDASDFVFFFVGAFSVDSIKPLIEKYIASLPSLHKSESWKDMGIRAPVSTIDTALYKGSDPKSIVALYMESSATWIPEDAYMFDVLKSLLQMRYIDVLREEMSGVYGFDIDLNLVKVPYEHYEFTLYIPCSPENTDKLTKAALNEIIKIQNEGVSNEDILKVKETERMEKQKEMKENGPWIGNLVEIYRNSDPGIITQYEERINRISSAEIQRIARKIDINRYVRVVLYPEQKMK